MALNLTPGIANTVDGVTWFTIATDGTFIEHAVTGDGDDRLTGNTFGNRLHGMRGNDVLIGGLGGDTLDGGAGSDVCLFASAIEYTADRVDGGAGVDRLRFTSSTAGQTLVLSNSVKGIEIAEISTSTGLGAGSLTATTALDLTCSAVGSGLQIFGNNGANRLTGTSFVDTITGNSGIDVLAGGKGNDILIGGIGKDTLTGGANNDTFRFLAGHSGVGANADVITDFDRAAMGDDRIDLSLLRGPALIYRHNGAFTAPGQVRILDVAGPDVIVEVNLSGNSVAEMQIRLTATTLASMAAGDFLL
jgi:Ca2+-binding RTX toxin-like protein